MAIELPSPLINEIMSLAGIFVFAISGAVAGIRRQCDIFGVLVLAVTASLFGGIARDVLLGALPPANLQSWEYLAAAGAAAVVSFYFYPLVSRLDNPVEIFDAIGLGVFTVIGTEKALFYGLNAPWAIVLGVITAIGGGIARDVLLGQMPIVLRAEIYATAALLGSAIVAVCYRMLPQIPSDYALAAGAAVCTTLRLLALHYRWHINISPPS